MPFETANEEIVLSPEMEDNSVIVYDDEPSPLEVVENHREAENNQDDIIFDQDYVADDIVATEEKVIEINFAFPHIPGADEDEYIEVADEDLEVKDEEKQEEKKSKGPWDWKTGGLENFLQWLKGKFENVPKHNGKSTVGVERAVNYLHELDACISAAMRSDLDGVLDASKIEEIRLKIDDGLKRLEERLETLEKNYRSGKKKKKEASSQELIVKEANTPAIGYVIAVPAILSVIARTCINSTISAGHDLEECLHKQIKIYDLDKREIATVIQLLADMGLPIQRDRLHQIDQEYDQTSSDNADFSALYPA